jgi:hypothetical protein
MPFRMAICRLGTLRITPVGFTGSAEIAAVQVPPAVIRFAIVASLAETDLRNNGAKTFGPESKNVLYSIGTTVYRLSTRWQLVTLKLSMKRRRPKSLLVVVAAAGVPSEGAI